MKIKEIYSQKKLAVTYEVFPPKTDKGVLNLIGELKKLKKFNPAFVSITYGAGGSTQDRSTKLIDVIVDSCRIMAVPHFTCIGSNKKRILKFLEVLKDLQIKNILALRGDPPSNNPDYVPDNDSFRYANELVEFIKENSKLDVAVAGYPDVHPEAKSLEEDISNLKKKVDAGASAVITQLFYDNNSFYRFVDKTREAGITVPIIPGILPLTSFNQIDRIIKLCRVIVPKELKDKIIKCEGNNSVLMKIGIEYAIYQIKKLIDFGVKGIHMYTLNKAEVTTKVLDATVL